MTFLKLRCERAYVTGALRTTLSLREFAGKMKRIGLQTKVVDGAVHIDSDGATWIFGDWQQDGMSQTGWLRFTMDTQIGGLSRLLARHGIRHRFEHSRPRDLDSDDVRCITSYDFRWNDHSLNPGAIEVTVETYDEAVAGGAHGIHEMAQ
jgi:hypothetical protein